MKFRLYCKDKNNPKEAFTVEVSAKTVEEAKKKRPAFVPIENIYLVLQCRSVEEKKPNVKVANDKKEKHSKNVAEQQEKKNQKKLKNLKYQEKKTNEEDIVKKPNEEEKNKYLKRVGYNGNRK